MTTTDDTVRIGDVADVLRGVTYKKELSSSEPARGMVPILRATNIGDELAFDGLVYVPDTFVSSQQMLRVGDIVLAASSGSAAVVGKGAVLRSPWSGSFGAFCFAVRLSRRELLPGYLGYFIRTLDYRRAVSALAAGVNINNLRRGHVEDLRVPLHPVAEQHRIVSALDSYFSRLDAAEAALQRVEANLKRYRAAVLKAAVEGRLVPTEADLARKEGRDYEPASVLLDRILAERRRKWEEAELAKMVAKGKPPANDKWKAKYKEPTPPDTEGLPELPEGWCWATISQLADVTDYVANGSFASLRANVTYQDGEGYAVLVRTTDATSGWQGPFKYVTRAAFDFLAKSSLHAGDLLVCNVGNPGLAFQVPDLGQPMTLGPNAVAVHPYAGPGMQTFLRIYIQSTLGRAAIEGIVSSTAQRKFNKTQFRGVVVPLPPQSEILEILAAVDRLDAVGGDATALVDGALRRAKRLRQSILKWAFEGRLVDQDPSDEPASVLLERIRAEREAAGARPNAKRATRKRKAKS